ncbi:transcriptional adapter 1-like [Coccinella septempunctata]|uniref:transcriptional adapter 1-like n=1 Tax=Coccinella septempunctata TaxID=41139 RepID=UPI001D08592E|nr:transcriptional adapter 1-like [Coccinella septempunctata]
MDSLNEARVQLESVVGADLLKEYFAILRQWFLLNSPVNKEEFDRQARKLLLNEEQIVAHNRFLRALLEKTSSDTSKITQTIEPPEPQKYKSSKVSDENGKSSTRRGHYQPAEFVDYVQPLSPSKIIPNDFNVRSAASELFMPDQGFISTRIALTAWENGLHGAEANVTDVLVHSCQTFVKNILTAMISRKKGFKVRDGKFQYGFNLPIPDPFLRNYSNVVDDTEQSRIEVLEDEDSFVPRPKPSLERIEQQLAFAYSSSKRTKVDNILSVQLLYDTLKDHPKLLGFGASSQVHLLKLDLQTDSQ